MPKEHTMNSDPKLRMAYLRAIKRLEAHPRRQKEGVTLDEIDRVMQPSDGLVFVAKILVDLQSLGLVEKVNMMHWRAKR